MEMAVMYWQLSVETRHYRGTSVNSTLSMYKNYFAAKDYLRFSFHLLYGALAAQSV